MQTYKLYASHPNTKILDEIADSVRQGALLIYPTDSVYAIGCNALKESAVERVYRYRKDDRQQTPLSIICRDISQAAAYVRISDKQYKVLRRHLPGPFTFILQAGLKLPRVFRSRRTVGVRVPDQPLLQALLAVLDVPLLTTSLKVEGAKADESEYFTDPFLIEEQFQHQADILLDGGEGLLTPSTVVDLTADDDSPLILRQGAGLFEG